ncbi:ATP-binding protein [Ornithinibacillus scapharcae]|uniref:ATP-binding protein n=1 Tax=Ornithinibacillus scapharcae TaxID=1147159 RepID=UPI000225B7B3|nr:AAA family ATPase [Ornithinibacillus scapharcae]
MKILQARIYGFGKWVDYEIDFSKHSFITIFGHNESGKSTLQRFLQFMLFGLPPKQRKYYQPKDSSKMGGRLFILDTEIGEYSIERIGDANNGAAKCFTPDGKEYDESWLKERLHSIDEKTYRAIFSFSAMDLNDLQDVKEEEISEVLLGIGLSGSTKIYSVEKRLEQQIGEFFKPYGKNPIINQQLQTLERLQREIKELKEEEAEYREKKNAIHRIKGDITLLEKTIKEEKERQFQLEKLIQAFPQIEEYIGLQNRLKELPEEFYFPEDGMERIESLKRELIPLESEIKLAIRNREIFQKEMEKLEGQNSEISFIEAKKIITQSNEYQDMEKEKKVVRERVDQLHREIRSKLSNLNLGLEMEQLSHYQLPFHLEKDWNHYRISIESITREMRQIKENTQLQQAKLERITEELSRVESSQLTADKRSELEGILELHHESQLLEIVQKEHYHKQEKWKKTKLQKRKRLNALWIGSLFLGVVTAALSFITDQFWLINISVLSLIVGLLQWFLGVKSIQNMDKMLEPNTTTPFRTISVEERRSAESLLLQEQEILREKELLQDKLLDTEIQLQQLTEKQVVIENQQDELMERIALEKTKYPFLEHVDLNYWPELYHTLKGILDQIKQIDELYNQDRDISQKLDVYHNLLDKFIEKHYPSSNFKSYISKLEFLGNEISAYQDREQQIQQLKIRLQDIENQVQEKTISYELVEERIISLFSKANAKDEEEFYKRYREWKEQTELLESCRRIATQISSYFTSEKWNNIIENPPSRSKVELELKECVQLIKHLEEELGQKRQQLANLTVELQNLEKSESYSKTIHVFQMEKERLHKLARKWAVLKTAKELLSETKHQYRDKYLTRVLEKTTQYFRNLTDHQYVQVFSPTADKPFMVENSNKIRFSVKELSQGTINQLYVSLRLAISEVMSEKFHLPFIIDDAFVHFDKLRNKRMLEILESISKNHQILFFTCKQDVLEEIPIQNLVHLTNHIPLVENKW